MEAAIGRYIEARIPAATGVTISNLSRIPGGASRETWLFDAAWDERGQRKQHSFVLRKDMPASLVESDRAAEYTFYTAFAGTAVPVPRMRWLENDAAPLGGAFFIMDRIVGCESNTRRIRDADYGAARPLLAKQLYEIAAAIHTFDWEDTPIANLRTPPEPDECWKRELDYWEGMINANEITPQPIARAAIRWLRNNPPPPAQRVSVVHGDYRVGNILYDTSGIRAVLDWEMAHLGDPLEDIAWSFMELWRFGTPLMGGIVTGQEAVRAWETASGLKADPEVLHWWDVFSGVKGQAIWLTGAKSFDDRRSHELIHAYTSWGLINRQDEVLLHSLGRSR